MSSLLPPAIPESFGRYQVQGLVGEGSMGRVYRAYDPLASRVVALKTLKSEYLTSDTRDEYLKRFRREAQAAGALSHPHIITVYDVGDDFFVMELLDGRTLQDHLRERGRLELADALRILGPVADALDFAHTKGTIHRDIKPGNIMVLPDGRPTIMDFGVAHLTSTVMTAAGQFLGSPSYMAPEQIMKSEASALTDLFSFAVVSYEVLTGRKPFEGESITTIIYKVVNEEPPPPRRWNAALPPPYDTIFARALDKEPSRRYPSAAAFMAALEMREIEGLLVTSQAPAPPGSGAEAAPVHEVVETVDLKAEEAARTVVAEPGTLPPLRPPAHVRRRRGLLAAAGAALAAFLGLSLWGGLFEGLPTPLTTPLPALRVESNPPGATITIDGKDVGHSPLTLTTVPPGAHTVRVVREGFAPAQLSFELVAGVTLAPLRFALQPTSATLSLRSEPAPAAVFVDGKAAGTTPLDRTLLDPGPHDVRVEHKGFHIWTRHLEAHVGERLDLVARLEGAVRAGAAPPKASAWVREGDLVDLTPDVTPPKRIAGEPAPYPEAARRLRLGGAVTIDMIITEGGEPSQARIVESAGEILDDAVLRAVSAWRFEPARKGGVKVRVHWPYRQHFRLQG